MNNAPELTSATLLVVDDTPENLDVLVGILRQEYRVKVATSGEKALKIASGDNPPDLILLDVMMPGLDGYEVCRRLKANPATASIPVIFVTAKDEPADEARGFELGAVDYITKPVSPCLVRARVATQLALFDQERFLEALVHQRTEEMVRTLRRLHDRLSLGQVAEALADLNAWSAHHGIPLNEASL